MPDVVRLRYLGAEAVSVPVIGKQVEPDCIVDFPGVVLEDNEDHYLIETGNPPEQRSWAKFRWCNETVAKKASKKTDDETDDEAEE